MHGSADTIEKGFTTMITRRREMSLADGGQGRRGAPASVRRGQRGEERRIELLDLLRSSTTPVLGSDLATHFGVSRQVLVQDIAILRAAGSDIIATPRGYLVHGEDTHAHRTVIYMQHEPEQVREELTILVDHGIHILDVAIEHPILGQLRGPLSVASRQDIDDLLTRMMEAGVANLPVLTGGRHTHTIEYQRSESLERAKEELRQRGFLVE